MVLFILNLRTSCESVVNWMFWRAFGIRYCLYALNCVR